MLSWYVRGCKAQKESRYNNWVVQKVCHSKLNLIGTYSLFFQFAIWSVSFNLCQDHVVPDISAGTSTNMPMNVLTSGMVVARETKITSKVKLTVRVPVWACLL